jgi:Fe-S-cluster-containing dehydrogenase component
MEPAMKILTTPRMERCIGCNSCSLACARLVHKRLSWLAAGIKPEKVTIPKRFTELTTWKGNTDINYLNALKSAYAEKINDML